MLLWMYHRVEKYIFAISQIITYLKDYFFILIDVLLSGKCLLNTRTYYLHYVG
jgi:hypothetical protein